jgi:hypothetical protein
LPCLVSEACKYGWLARICRVRTCSLCPSACIASLVRLAETPVLSSSLDTSLNISKIAVWAGVLLLSIYWSRICSDNWYSVIEANLGIICASSSILPAFVDRHCPKTIKTSIAHLWSRMLNRGTAHRDGSNSTSTEQNVPDSNPKTWPTHNFVELHEGS